jgi:3-oxoacyl-[acyl-carrier-protein] synthase III
MAIFQVSHSRIAGIASAVPAREVHNRDYDLISEAERQMLVKTTGIATRHVAEKGQSTSDLCFAATGPLLDKLKWQRDEIDLLVFVSQSRDYLLPATAVILQDRLGLSKRCAAFDIALGCSGYVYGLSVVYSMLATGGFRKALLMAGDISSVAAAETDKSTYPLFGDAGTVTAIEYSKDAGPATFNLQSDGSGYEAIIIPHGGIRGVPTNETFITTEYEKGITRHKGHLALNGAEVFTFSVREAGPNLLELVNYLGKDLNSFDYFIFHQANLLMNETIRKKLKLPPEKVPYSLHDYGNTSSASIPLTLCTMPPEQLSGKKELLLSGFGVGLSWGSVALQTENPVLLPVLKI